MAKTEMKKDREAKGIFKDTAKSDTIKRVLKHIGAYRWLVLLSLALSAVTVALTLYIPILIGQAVDLITGEGQVDFDGLFRIFGIMAAVILVTAAAQWLMNAINNHITYRVAMDVREKAFCHLEILPLKYIDGHSYGDVLSRVITDVDQFSDGLLMGFTQLFSGILTIFGTLVFMFSVNPFIALVVVLVTPLSLLAAGYIAKKTFSMFQEQSEARGEMTSLINEIVENEKVVQAFSYEQKAEERFDKINSRLESSQSPGYLLFFYYKSGYPVCKRPGVRKRGNRRGGCGYPWSFERGTADFFLKLCKPVYKAV